MPWRANAHLTVVVVLPESDKKLAARRTQHLHIFHGDELIADAK